MIILRLDRMLAERKISSKELAERVGISQVNMSRIKTGKVSAVRFSTLDAICRALDWNICLTMKPITSLDLKINRHNLATSA
jgi:putative transcriptional regulator